MVISDRTKGCDSSDLNKPRTPTMTNLLNLTHTTRECDASPKSIRLRWLTGITASLELKGSFRRVANRFRRGGEVEERRRGARSGGRLCASLSAVSASDISRPRAAFARPGLRGVFLAPSRRAWHRPRMLGFTERLTARGHRQPPTAFETHNGRSTFVAGTAVDAPNLPFRTRPASG